MQSTPPVGVTTAPEQTILPGSSVHPSVGNETLCDVASVAAGRDISPTLYNLDLAPTKKEGRRWTSYSIFTLWANDVHSLGNYAFAIGLFSLGLGGWQILVALGIGAVLLFTLLTFSGFMGQKTGVPFPVMSRISFGIRGAQLASLVRGAVAIAWFGIQTYLASVVLRVMLVAMFPGSRRWTPTRSSACPPLVGSLSYRSGLSSWSLSASVWK
ncbi:probable allantoin permease [Arthrobacter sp. Hiyo8]|nr:probable allantoin permease [Arthrobacter sp. Hiyo8]